MNAREEAEQLRQEAIGKLLEEQKAIAQQLELLGYGKENASTRRCRGRRPKAAQTIAEDSGQTQHPTETPEVGSNSPVE